MSAPEVFFITGTDTDAGKTFVGCGLLAAALSGNISTAAVKPVAAGVINTERGLQNEDAVLLAKYCSVPLEPDEINPVCFGEPIAPHIAAAKSGMTLNAAGLAEACRRVMDKQAGLTLIEGAGGWKVPLSGSETTADLVKALEVPVILVVGMRLGCLNHALLSAQAILNDGCRLTGWYANRIDPGMAAYEENLATLTAMMPAPLLGEIPWSERADPEETAGKIMLDSLIGIKEKR